MQSHRIISGLTIFLMVAIIAAGYFLVAQPQLAAASTAGDALTALNAQIASSQSTITQLKGEQSKLPALKSQLASLRQSIPTDAQISAYIDDLNALGTASGVSITGITVGAAQAYTPPAPAAGAATTAPTATSTATPSPSATGAATDTTAPATPTAWSPTTDPTITESNFVAIPITVTTSGQQAATLSFIKGLQSGTRLFLVSQITMTADSVTVGNESGTIQGYIYVLLDSTTTPATASAGTGATGATASPSAAPDPSGTATPTPTQSPTPSTKP